MWKSVFIIAAATAGLTGAIATNADARVMGMGAREGANFNTNFGMHESGTRAQVRGPEFRPRGWSEGRKTGWHCRVGTRGCIPPGLR